MSDYPEDFPLSDDEHEEYLAHEAMEAFDDWGFDEELAWQDEYFRGLEHEDYWDEDFDEGEYAMPLDEIVEILDIDVIVTNEGFLLKKEIHILANGQEVPHEYYLEIGCDENYIPF
jgi:hypothetical protein